MVDSLLPGRLQVALVTETYPPEVNGVAATVSRVVEGLRERSHLVQVIRPQQPGEVPEDAADRPAGTPAAAELLVRGWPIPRYPGLRMGRFSRATLLREWVRRRPDVVHIVTEGPLGWSALQAARKLGLPVVSDFRTNFQSYSGHYGMAWLRTPILAYLRHFHNRTATTMVPTESLRSELAAAGLRGLQVVARGVDTRLFSPERRSVALRASWGAGPHTTVALCVGRLAAEKNLGQVLQAAQAMRDVHPDTQLVLVGEGPDRQRLMHLDPQARFAGLRRGEDLAAHYASADVFLFASTTETFGNVVPEAMASGLAVLAYDHAAAGQLIRHGDNGLLAAPGHIEAFCLLAQGLAGDAERIRRLGDNARQTARQLDWERIVVAVELAYRAAVSTLPAPASQRPAVTGAAVAPRV